MTTNGLYLIFGLIIIGFAFIVIFINKKFQDLKAEPDDKSLLLIQQQLNQVSEQLNKGMVESNKTIQEQFRASAGIIKDVTEKLTKLDETNKQVVNFAEQMKSLENILKNPKQRGILGEYILETLLNNILPPSQYQMQYSFKNGTIVDAAIFYNDLIIPIDAKFSLEKYNLMMQETDKDKRDKLEKEFKADVKNRIDETSKYIQPNQKTTEFAFMFIPAEGIYYNLLIYDVGSTKVNTHDLIEYAFSKRVIIVSPTSFFAYLETVMQGLKALKIEESVHQIVNKIGDLQKHLGSYEEFMTKVGNNLSTTVNSYNAAYKEFGKIDKDVTKITGEKIGVDVLAIDKPKFDED